MIMRLNETYKRSKNKGVLPKPYFFIIQKIIKIKKKIQRTKKRRLGNKRLSKSLLDGAFLFKNIQQLHTPFRDEIFIKISLLCSTTLSIF